MPDLFINTGVEGSALLMSVTVHRNVVARKPGWAPLAEKRTAANIVIICIELAGPAGPEHRLHGLMETRWYRATSMGAQGSLCQELNF